MKPFMMLSSMVLSFLLVMPVSAESIERLFTTMEQRQQIDQQRWQAKHPSAKAQAPAQVQASNRRFSFDALISTEQGSVVWVNGKMYDRFATYEGVSFDPKSVRQGQLTLSTSKGVKKLSLGKVYWIDHGKVLEAYEKP